MLKWSKLRWEHPQKKPRQRLGGIIVSDVTNNNDLMFGDNTIRYNKIYLAQVSSYDDSLAKNRIAPYKM